MLRPQRVSARVSIEAVGASCDGTDWSDATASMSDMSDMSELSTTACNALRIDPELARDHAAPGCLDDLKLAVSPLTVLDSLPDGIFVTDRSGTLRYRNPKWSELFGSPSDNCADTAVLGRMNVEDRQLWRDCRARALTEARPYVVEYRLPYPDAPDGPRWHWYSERGCSIPDLDDGDNARWVAIVEPISEYKQHELELTALIERRDAFLAMLLHELRNPLTPIAHALELLGRNPDDASRVRRARGVIQRQLRQISRLVDDLLEASTRQGAVSLQYADFDLNDSVAVAAEAAKPLIELRHQHLMIELPEQPIRLHADPIRLGQVLTNLLINSSKYTPDGGHITIIGTLDGTTVTIRVRDDGIGIAKDKLADIFELFTQVAPSSINRTSGGLGIGLAVARQIVEAHGGSIAARSEGAGRGAEFIVRMPQALATAERAIG